MYLEGMEEFDNVCFTCYCCRKTLKGMSAYYKCLEKCRRNLNEGKKFQHYNVHNIGDNSSSTKKTYIIDPTNLKNQSKAGSQIKFQCEFCEDILESLQDWMQHRSETHSMHYQPPSSRGASLIETENDADLVMTRLNIKAQKSYSHLIKCPAEQCGFYPATMIYTHIQKDHPNSTLRYNCSICGDIFATEYDVVSHRMDEHKDQIDNEMLDDENSNDDDNTKADNIEVDDYQTLQEHNDVTIQETVIVTEDISNIGQQQVLNNVLSQEKQQSPKQSSVFLSLKADDNEHIGANIVNTSGIIWPKKRGRPPKARPVSPKNITLQTPRSITLNTKKPTNLQGENEENNEPEYIKFTEGNHYIDEKNDIQLTLAITRAPPNNQYGVRGRYGVMKSPKLFKAKSRLGHDMASPMLSVVQPREENIDGTHILQQYHLQDVQSTNESQDVHTTTNQRSAGGHIQYHIQDVQSTANVVTDGEARMIVVAAGSTHQMVVGEDGGTVQTLGATVETLEGAVETLGDGHQQTYFIQHPDGSQIQEIQAKVISEAEAMDEGVETVEMSDQTILQVQGADGEQPTFVIQSQQFEVR